MAEINKLSVEKVLEEIRSRHAPKSKNARFDEKIDELDEEVMHMRGQ